MNWTYIGNNLINVSFGLSLITLIIYWTSITFTSIKMLNLIGTIFTILINTLLSTYLAIRWINYGHFPLSNLYESLIFLAWSITLIHLILEKQNKTKLIGSISTPITLFIISFASFALPIEMQKATPLVPALRSNWLMMHVSIMMLSYAILIIGSLLSILFLIIAQDKYIKLQGNAYGYSIINTDAKFNSSQESVLNIKSDTESSKIYKRMNLLQSIDNLSYRIIGLGFPLLTIGIIAGAVWANETWGSYWSWDPKETWALITWLIFAAYLHSRFAKSWTGKKPAILASIGFIVVWICYLGVNFLGKGLHSYGWIAS